MTPTPIPKLSPTRLRKAFEADLAAAWTRFCAGHAKETPYAFALYGVEGGWPHLTPVVMTEESLTRVAGKYVEKGHYDTLEEARKALRYSTADSPHVRDLERSTPNVDKEFEPHAERLGDDEGYEALATAAMKALANLDAQGLFGTGTVRDQLLLIIITEDIDKDWSTPSAKKLNPKIVYDQFEQATAIEGEYASCSSLALSPDAKSLYCTGGRRYRPAKPGGKEEDVSEIIAFALDGFRLTRRWTFQFPTFGDSGRKVALSSDGRSLFVLRAQYQDKACHSLLLRFAVDHHAVIETRDVIGEPASFALASDGSGAAISMHNKTLHLFDRQLRPTHQISLPSQIYSMQYLQSGDLLIAGENGIFRRRVNSGDAELILAQRAHRLALDHQEQLLAVSRWFDSPSQFNDQAKARAKEPFGVQLFRWPSLEPLPSFDVPGHQCVTVALSPDGKLLALEAHALEKQKCWLIVFDVETRREIARRKSNYISDLCFFPDGRHLAVTENGYTTTEPIVIWGLPE